MQKPACQKGRITRRDGMAETDVYVMPLPARVASAQKSLLSKIHPPDEIGKPGV